MTGKKIVAIHQPNFFPWLGYFNKLARADLFLLLDNVQFPKTGGGTWINRVRVLVQGRPAWVTLPVVRSYHGLRLIGEMKIDNAAPWREKLIKTIRMNYARAPFFDEVFPAIAGAIGNPTDSLTDYNLSAIKVLASSLRMDTTKLALSSALKTDGAASTDLLITLVKAVGGTSYLCGGGAAGYQEDAKFEEAGIELIYQNFEHPIYPQHNSVSFVSGLSVIDPLMNRGFEGTRGLIAGD